MFDTDKIRVLVELKNHFPQTTDGDGELVWKDVRGLELCDVLPAIEAHRREKGDRAFRPNPQRLRALAYTNLNQRTRRSQETTTLQWVRLEARNRGEDLRGMRDADVLIAHFSEAWQRVKGDAEEDFGRNVARAYLLNHARIAFREIGMDAAATDAHARDCVELKPGEKIPRRPLFMEPEPARDASWDALKALARAEYGEEATAGVS